MFVGAVTLRKSITSARRMERIDAHIAALSLYFVFYNFVKTHKAHKLSPVMAAGVADRLWSMEDIVALIDVRAPKPGKRGLYKKATD